MKYSANEMLHLINLYRENEILWNTKHKLFKRPDIKKNVLDKIGKEFDTTGEEIKKKLISLRSTYRAERSKVLVKKSGKGNEDDDLPTSLFWFEEMSFLDDTITIRPRKTNVVEPKNVILIFV